MLDNDLLTDFASHFYGYGNYASPYWFVGMEEGGGDTTEEIERRITAWKQRGRNELEDLVDYHHAIGINRWFTGRIPLQSTWSKLIRIILAAKGGYPTQDGVRQYQGSKLGRRGGENCLIELLPLPSRRTDLWEYAKRSDLSHLSDRTTYSLAYKPKRIQHIRDRINEFQPQAVVFYGSGYRESWYEIASVPFTSAERFEYVSNGPTSFWIVSHPVATGITNEYFEAVGRLIQEV